MKLYYSTTSPFARKILIALKILKLEPQCQLVLSNPFENPEDLLTANPLGKIPALSLDNGTTLSDSNLIFQYLDSISGHASLYPCGSDRWEKLQFSQLAEGILTAAVAIVIERKRPESYQLQTSIDRQYSNIARSLLALEQHMQYASADKPSVLEITLGTALDYLSFRLADINWRGSHSQLLDWHNIYSQRQEMLETIPKA